MRRSRYTLYVLLVCAVSVCPLSAHAPYERIRATITDPQGRQLTVVAKYVDGIIGTDPVTVVVRAQDGVVLAEAPQARDAIVRCDTFESCLVYLYEPPFNLFPERVLRLTPTGFVDENASRYVLLGLLLPIRHHFRELLFESLAFAIVPLVAQLLARRRRSLFVVVAWWAFVPLGFLWLTFVLLGVTLNSVVSFVWLALAVATLSAFPLLIASLRIGRLSRGALIS